MSKYQSMEQGAVRGARDRSTGPVTLYRFGMGGGTSRSCNRTEDDPRLGTIEDEHRNQLAAVHERMAQVYLTRLRELVAEHKTHHHVIWIEASMGSISVMVGDMAVDMINRRCPVIDRLQEIDQYLEGQWDWASYLDGERLNGERGNVRAKSKSLRLITVGTSHFVSEEAAVDYYAEYGTDRWDVAAKIGSGEIHIGPPSLNIGDVLTIEVGRYLITRREERHER